MDNQVNLVEELINKISSPGDVAAALLGGSIGLVVDILLLHLSIPAGYMTFLGLSVTLGVKKFFNVWQEPYKTHNDLSGQTDYLLDRLRGAGDKKDEAYLLRQRDLWESGILDNEEFGKALADLVKTFMNMEPGTNPVLELSVAVPKP